MVLSRDLARFGLFVEAEIWSHDSLPNLICKNLAFFNGDVDLPGPFLAQIIIFEWVERGLKLKISKPKNVFRCKNNIFFDYAPHF